MGTITIGNGNTPVACPNFSTILKNGGNVVENGDGSVSVYKPDAFGQMAPTILTKICCLAIKPYYTWDADTQTCRWSNAGSCNFSNPLKLVLNPKGNDGSLFYVEGNDNCSLSVDFDYLFKIKCETLSNILTNGVPPSPADIQTEVQIKALETQIAQQTILCQSLTNQITQLTTSVNATSYSIICSSKGGGNGNAFGGGVITDGVGVLSTGTTGGNGFGGGVIIDTGGLGSGSITGTGISSGGFGNTGFGLMPFGFGDLIVSDINYCLTEPAGLAQWAIILGNVNYQNFLNGQQNSYSCNDMQALLTINNAIITNNILNGQQNQILMQECNTPFGTKTNLIIQLNSVIQQKNTCSTTLSALTAQLTALKGTLNTFTSCNKPIQVFESFDVSMTIDIITSANTLQTVYENNIFPEIGPGNLYTYLSANTNSGFYICGDPTITETTFLPCTPLSLNISAITQPNVFSCDSIMPSIIQDLYAESLLSAVTSGTTIFANNIHSTAFQSKWLHFHTLITDPTILNLIYNKKIKISFKINHTCSDFCVLVDEIVLDKVCTHTKNNTLFLTKSPGFDLDRIRDNKKSWIANTTPTNRPFVISNNLGGNSIRQTNYDVNDERLVINTKEIDLDISIASAVETDVWCYIVDNPCLLSATCTPISTSCPAGYNPINGRLQCTKVETADPVASSTIYTAHTIPVSARTSGAGQAGGYFYEDITSRPWPIRPLTGGSYTTASTVVDNANNVVNVTDIERNRLWGDEGYPGPPVNWWLWRLNAVGIWPSNSGTNGPVLEWIGFSVCVDIPTTKTYVIGLAADDAIRVTLNGQSLIDESTGDYAWSAWRLFPITLSAGLNVVTIEGIQAQAGTPALFGFEIYDATVATLTGLTLDTQIAPYLLFSTLNLDGVEFNLGENSGFSCPTGFFLDVCDGSICKKTTTIDAITSGTCCNPCSAVPTPAPICCDKLFQDGDCFSFMDSEVYEFMDSTLSSDCNSVSPSCCPDGFVIQPDGKTCQKIENVPVITGATTYTVGTGATACFSALTYGELGGVFYENISNQYPITARTDGNYHTLGTLGNSSGATLPVQSIVLNNLWGSGTTSPNCLNFRLNDIGVWTTVAPLPGFEWIGFSQCIDIPTTGTYSIGLGADDYVRVKINGTVIIDLEGNGWHFLPWRVFPITLEAGLNIIEIEGKNVISVATLGAEIYAADTSVISGITTYAALAPYIIFTTKGLIGQTFQTGENSGFSCPSGYALNTCNNPYTCDKVTKVSGDCPTHACCGDDGEVDFNKLMTQSLSAVTTIEDFEYFLSSELIDAKDRKTLSAYPTLRALYDRYMNSTSYCNTNSSEFDYQTMNQFASLVGNYWVDIVEQVIPATTIWGSVRIYSNTVFDQQKFKYRSYTSLFCGNPWSGQTVPSPINGKNGTCTNVSVSMTPLNNPTNTVIDVAKPTTICNKICLAQMNMGSEFIGTVSIVGPNIGPGNGGFVLGTGITTGGVIIVTTGGLGTGTTTGNGGGVVGGGSFGTFSGTTVGAFGTLGGLGSGNGTIGGLGSGTVGSILGP